MSAALLDYATRNRGLTFDPASRASAAQLNPDHDDFAEHTHQVRTLIDQLYRRDTDKEQAAALWATGSAARGGTRHAMNS